MKTSDNNMTMQGIGTNPGLLIRAPDHISEEAELTYGSQYLDGKAVLGKFTGQKLMETPWFPRGVLNNIIVPTVYLEASSPADQNQNDYITIIVYKRNVDEDLYETKELTVYYRTKTSPGVGQMPNSQWVNRMATEWPWFDIRYEYKFVVVIGKLVQGQTLMLEGLYLQNISNTAVMSPLQADYGPDSVQPIPIQEGMRWMTTVPANNGTYLIIDLTSDYLGSGGVQTGLYNNISSITTTAETVPPGGTPYITSYSFEDQYNGGFGITVRVTGLVNNPSPYDFYFNTSVFGYMTPKRM